jgi:preprotein translocase subunit SecB
MATSAADQTAETQAEGQMPQPGFGIEKLYVKDLSLEIPNAPQIFTEREVPQVGIEISNSASF